MSRAAWFSSATVLSLWNEPARSSAPTNTSWTSSGAEISTSSGFTTLYSSRTVWPASYDLTSFRIRGVLKPHTDYCRTFSASSASFSVWWIWLKIGPMMSPSIAVWSGNYEFAPVNK